MHDNVVLFCLLAATGCLIGFAFTILLDYKKVNAGLSSSNQTAVAIAARGGPPDTAEALSKLVDSTSKLIDSITKAGPGLAALTAAVFFTTVAAYVVTSKPDTLAAPAARPETGSTGDKPASVSTP